METQLWRNTCGQNSGQLRTQVACGFVQNLAGVGTNLGVGFALCTHHGEVDVGITEVFRDLDRIQGHHTQLRIFHFKLDHLRNFALDLLPKTGSTAEIFRHFYLSEASFPAW